MSFLYCKYNVAPAVSDATFAMVSWKCFKASPTVRNSVTDADCPHRRAPDFSTSSLPLQKLLSQPKDCVLGWLRGSPPVQNLLTDYPVVGSIPTHLRNLVAKSYRKVTIRHDGT